MEQNLINLWKYEALSQVLSALSENAEIRDVLIFKGALILNRRLGTDRLSLDIDSNLDTDFSLQVPDRSDQKSFLETHIPLAVSRYFEKQSPVRFEVSRVKVDLKPRVEHPKGWNAFQVKITLIDHQLAGVRGLPALTIDVAAPETLTEDSIDEIQWNGSTIRAYTLERIAGEKARAFLSTLPSYREKMKKPGEAIRVKDLYDLTRILENKPITDETFWATAGKEFQLACESRYIDCRGGISFKESWSETKAAFENESIIPRGIDFKTAEEALDSIVSLWAQQGVIPFEFALPT
jgi:hypothetical protein